jgi:hypothetical protein
MVDFVLLHLIAAATKRRSYQKTYQQSSRNCSKPICVGRFASSTCANDDATSAPCPVLTSVPCTPSHTPDSHTLTSSPPPRAVQLPTTHAPGGLGPALVEVKRVQVAIRGNCPRKRMRQRSAPCPRLDHNAPGAEIQVHHDHAVATACDNKKVANARLISSTVWHISEVWQCKTAHFSLQKKNRNEIWNKNRPLSLQYMRPISAGKAIFAVVCYLMSGA